MKIIIEFTPGKVTQFLGKTADAAHAGWLLLKGTAYNAFHRDKKDKTGIEQTA